MQQRLKVFHKFEIVQLRKQDMKVSNLTLYTNLSNNVLAFFYNEFCLQILFCMRMLCIIVCACSLDLALSKIFASHLTL